MHGYEKTLNKLDEGVPSPSHFEAISQHYLTNEYVLFDWLA